MRLSTRFLAAVAAAPLALGTVAAVETSELSPTTETLYISAGCPQDTPGTCTSTRWLGKATGDSSSNFLTATTPVNEAQYLATGAIQWRDYPGDFTLNPDGYLLDTSRDLEVDVEFTTNGVAVNNTVHLRATLTLCDRGADGTLTGCKSSVLTPPTKSFTNAGPGSSVVKFAMDLPATMENKVLRTMTVELANHGINAQGAYINQQGGSPVRIPHLADLNA